MNAGRGRRADVAAPRRGERGTVLLLFVVLLFAVFGLASLTIDLGLARLTQSTMQVATDGACVEGLRWRDMPVGDAPDVRERARRQSARRALLRAFDEDGLGLDGLADGTEPNDTVQLGAGPDLLDGGAGSVAGGGISIGATGRPVWVPDPQLNLDNFIQGDFVSGTHDPAFDPVACELGTGISSGFRENGTYDRCDFSVPAPPGDPDVSVSAPAFLARLRRTNDVLGLDNVAGVSSRGAPLPFLFGRPALDVMPGSAVHAGVTLRATSIADARPAVLAGPPSVAGPGLHLARVDTNGDGLGDASASLAFSVAAWETCLADGLPHTVTFGAAASLEVPGVCDAVSPAGRLVVVGATVGDLVAAGDSAAGAGDGSAAPPSAYGWVALYDDVDPDPVLVDERVVGFGAVVTEPASGPGDFDVSRVGGPGGAGVVAPVNARAVWMPDDHPILAGATLSAVLAANAALAAPLRAPALVR